jgi:hypothetical protein
MTAPGRGGPDHGQALPSSLRGAALVGLAVIVGIIGLQILDDSGTGTSDASSSSEVTTTTVAGALPAPHETRSDVAIKVYNASDVQNAAQQLSDKLKGLGYTTEDVANLNTTRKGTVVECRTGFEGDGQVIAVFGIGNATTAAFPSDPPEGADNADCIVILGTA